MHQVERQFRDLIERDDSDGLGYFMRASDHWAAGDGQRQRVRDRLVDRLITGDSPVGGLVVLEALISRASPSVVIEGQLAKVTVSLLHTRRDVEAAVVDALRNRAGKIGVTDRRSTSWGDTIELAIGSRVGLRSEIALAWPRLVDRRERLRRKLRLGWMERRYPVLNEEGEWAFRHLIRGESWGEIAQRASPSRKGAGGIRSYQSVQSAVARFWTRRGVTDVGSLWEDIAGL